MASTLQERIERAKADVLKAEREVEILSTLPDSIPAPTISNLGNSPEDLTAWLSWSAPAYDPERKWDAPAVFAALQAAGFKAVPATLARYGDYRRSPQPGLQDSIPETKHRAKLADCEPIMPMWIVPSQHINADAQAFMERDGKVFRVSVDIPRVVSLHARRVEYMGGWRLERGTGRLVHPASIESLADCGKCVHSGAWIDTEQGMSGALYFTPFVDQEETAGYDLADLLRRILDAK